MIFRRAKAPAISFVAFFIMALLAATVHGNTADGFLSSAIVLQSTDNLQMVRTAESIEYKVPDGAGGWVTVGGFPVGDMIKAKLVCGVTYDEEEFQYTYSYALSSDQSSAQMVDKFGFLLPTILDMEEIDQNFPYDFSGVFDPTGEGNWDFSSVDRMNIWYWHCSESYGIFPGSSETFSFSTKYPPGIVYVFAVGRYDDETWVNSDYVGEFDIPEWHQKGVVGFTIGPVPEESDPAFLTQRLIDFLQPCMEQKWIDNYVSGYLNGQLAVIIQELQAVSPAIDDARVRIDQCITFVSDPSTTMSNEARILFMLNLQALADLV